jgi:hypothetical protein
VILIAGEKIEALIARQEEHYVADRPRSRAVFARAGKSLFRGVPKG